MNLSKLFDLQKALDAPYSHVEDRLSKDILWLMEELGELAREWRGHKYRRPPEEQTPRNIGVILCDNCRGEGMEQLRYEPNPTTCEFCNGKGTVGNFNPLLEEYTDCLSIILSIGLQLGFRESISALSRNMFHHKCADGVIWQFNRLMSLTAGFDTEEPDEGRYMRMVMYLLGLGDMLGLTIDQIETNYIAKAEANAKRNA